VQLINYLKSVFAPVLEVYKLIVQGCTIFSLKMVDIAQGFGTGKNIRTYDCLQQPGKLCIGEPDAVE